MLNPTIISLLLDGALAGMQVKNHFDMKKLQAGMSQILGELPLNESAPDVGEFLRLLHELGHERGSKYREGILALMDHLTTPERTVFRTLIASRRSPSAAATTFELENMNRLLDKERLDFLVDVADIASNNVDEALRFLRTGVGITPKPALVDSYTKLMKDFASEHTPRLIGWVKAGALKTHAALFDTTPRKQSIGKFLLGKLLFGGTDGSLGQSAEIEFLNKLFARKGGDKET